MSTLEKIGFFDGEDDEGARLSFRNRVKKVLQDGGGSVMGVPIPIPLPFQELAAMQAEALEDNEDLGAIESSFVATARHIDKMLPENVINPPIVDPTMVLPDFPNILIDLGIENPLEWIETNRDELLNIDIEALSQCNNEDFVKSINAIDPTVDVEEGTKSIDESGVCGFDLPAFDISLDFDLPDFTFGFTPVELFAIPITQLQPFQINWTMQFFLLELAQIIIELIQAAIDLVFQLIEGVINFIIYLIEFLIEKIIEILLALIQPLLESILFVACIIAYLTIIIPIIIVCFIGYLIGSGVIVQSAANNLELG